MLSLRGKLFAALFFGLLLIVPPATAAASRSGEISCNGSSLLCDRKLNEVVLPGSHNSMSAKELGWFNPNQTYSIPDQLKRGARAMLFDTYYGNPQPNGQVANVTKAVGKANGSPLYLCHVSCIFGATALIPELRKIADFLKANPNEVLVFVNEDKVDPVDFDGALDSAGLLDYIYSGTTGPWPTLAEMIASDQRVVVLAEQDAAGVPWYHEAYDGPLRETPYSFNNEPSLLTAPEQLSESCRPNRGEVLATDGSLFLMNHWISTATPSSFEPNIEYAKLVNRKEVLVERARACEQRRGFLPNILAVDFFGTGDVVGAANQLNGVAAKATLRSSRLKPIVVRSGQRRLVSVLVNNDGDAPARSVRVCASLPAKLAPRPACVTLGEMLAGERAAAGLRLKIKGKAEGSGVLKVTISSTGRPVVLKANIKIRPARQVRTR